MFAFLAAVGQVGRIPHQRRDPYGAETVTFGYRSNRYTLTLYDKATEIRKHPLSPHLDPGYRDKLTEWATGKVRVELSIRHHALPERDLSVPLLE